LAPFRIAASSSSKPLSTESADGARSRAAKAPPTIPKPPTRPGSSSPNSFAPPWWAKRSRTLLIFRRSSLIYAATRWPRAASKTDCGTPKPSFAACGTLDEIASGVSLGIRENPAALVKRVHEELSSGYQRIKLKIKPGKDLEYVAAVRKEFPNILLSVDANSAYTLNDVAHLKSLDEFNLLMMEQPLSWDDIYAHSKLQPQIETAICLDECIFNTRHALAAIELEACRIINVKLGRVSGHTEARLMQAACLERKIPVWCGGMLESGIGRAHNIAMSTLPGFTLPGDVSASSRYWKEDIIDPAVEVTSKGTIKVPKGPGLGYNVRRDRIDKVTVRINDWIARRAAS
jgi:o-succinylbenzoate synthase